MVHENATNQGISHIPAYGASCPCDNCQRPLDTPGTLTLQGGKTSSAGKSEGTERESATAGVAPNGTESRTGVKTETEEDFDFFRHLMETNEPVPGISAENRDWMSPAE